MVGFHGDFIKYSAYRDCRPSGRSCARSYPQRTMHPRLRSPCPPLAAARSRSRSCCVGGAGRILGRLILPRLAPRARRRRRRASTARRCPRARPRPTSRSPTSPGGASRSRDYRGRVAILAFLYSTLPRRLRPDRPADPRRAGRTRPGRRRADRERRSRRRQPARVCGVPRTGVAERAREYLTGSPRAAARGVARLRRSCPRARAKPPTRARRRSCCSTARAASGCCSSSNSSRPNRSHTMPGSSRAADTLARR